MPRTKIAALLLLTALALSLAAWVFPAGQPARAETQAPGETLVEPAPAFAQASNELYLPSLMTGFPRQSPFGFDPGTFITRDAALINYARDLDVAWSRMGGRISWARLQPVENGPILWDQLAGFEAELRSLRLVGDDVRGKARKQMASGQQAALQ
jgi:hypothetical protein